MVEADPNNMSSSVSIEEDDKDLAKPDDDLLAFQNQRKTPAISLASVGLDGEKLELEVDNVEQLDQTGSNLGMAAAGTEEKIIRQLHKQGSFDQAKLQEVARSPGLKASAADADGDHFGTKE